MNFITLPEGLRVMWTGMEVRKYDRASNDSVGFLPDIPAEPTIAAIRSR